MGTSTGTADGNQPTPEHIERQHVYVINDSPEILAIIRNLLQDERYKVTTTNVVPRSFETIEAVQPSLLIIDLVHGVRDGWQLLTALQQHESTNGIPVLLVSTSPNLLDTAREQHEALGGDRYLDEPFDLDDLLVEVEQLIGHV